MSLNIAYLAQVFPYLSETFVWREVLTLREKGVNVKTFATWQPELNKLSEESRGLVTDTFYIFPIRWTLFLSCHAWYGLTRPRRYAATLWYCLTRPHKTLANRKRTLLHFCQAIYVAREMERQRIQHIHVHFALNATTIAMVVSRLTGISFSFTAHANDLFLNPILLPEKIEAAAFIIAISDYNKRFIERIVPSPKTTAKTHVVHCGIDVATYNPQHHRPEGERFTILTAAQLTEKKGHPYLIKACRFLADRGYPFRCIIAGDGPEADRLQQMVRERRLEDCMVFIGPYFQDQIRDYLHQADIAVLPCVVASNQDMDGIPNTLMEAMAMEIPVISTTVSGIPELVEDMKTGLLVPPEDDMALANAIILLIKDKALRERLGKAGRAKVVEAFEINKNVDRLIRIFQARPQ